MENKNVLKGMCAVILLVLITSSTTPAINYTHHEDKLPTMVNKGSYQPTVISERYDIIVEEGFEEGIMPPTNWTHYQNNAVTWEINTSDPHGGIYHAICLWNSTSSQDEWIVTVKLDLKNYTAVYLSFWWMMSYYWAVYPYDNYDLNVYITTNDEVNWTLLWNEDTIGKFDDYDWTDTTFDTHVDLSEYVGETNVKIGFQYAGSDGAAIFLDDILVYGTPIHGPPPLIVDAHGPYEAYCTEDIYFEGSATGGVPPYDYMWDFGDGNTSDEQNPVFAYLRPNTYNVTLTVYDSNNSFNWNNTYAIITDQPKLPELKIEEIKGGLGLKVTFKNTGGRNATDLDWIIQFRGGIFNLIHRDFTGNFSELGVGETKTVRTYYFIGCLGVTIKIELDASNAARVTKERTALKVGPFIFNIKN